ncbi:MAG TPA: sensor histidine kinase N-terminal domain-containing protein [Burkholderiaceae bacterium]|nr:sensor histidine kinase N-terminal domain-containing protein [Burkholderiaceae bacterium]
MDTTEFGRSRGLKSILLWSLVPALVLFLTVALFLSNQRLRAQINFAYDRSLTGALRAIDHQISTASGGLSVELPYLMLQFFETAANERVYFRVMTEDGLADVGNQRLPLPDGTLISNVPVFYTTRYLGVDVRIAAMARRMDPPLYGHASGRVVVLVGEDVDTREAFINSMLWRSVQRDLAAVLLVILIVVLAVLFAVRPLTRLRQEVAGRGIDDLRPMEARGLPAEVAPLVTAINLHMDRYARQASLQNQFLDDASHQLRTPLTVLRAQLDYALRESDPQELRAVLRAMREGLDRSVRTANQMLALARVRDFQALEEGGAEFTDLAKLAAAVASDMYPTARTRRLDLGLERPDEAVLVRGPEWLLREAVVNVLDNALRYTPTGGVVTLRVRSEAGRALIQVDDDGPGMSVEDIAKAGVRFRRGKAGKNTSGAGLGLAIVHAIVQQLRGEFRLESEGRGCRATLVFTLVSGQKSGEPA